MKRETILNKKLKKLQLLRNNEYFMNKSKRTCNPKILLTNEDSTLTV